MSRHARPVIGIDASRITVGARTGTETYALQIIRHLARDLAAACSLRGYLNARVADLPADAQDLPLDWREIPFPRLWTHARLSLEMLTRRPDLLFVPAHVIPIVHPRSVVTIHDLGYLRYPEAHTTEQVRMLDRTTRWSARVARRIIVPSEMTRRDLIDAYDIPAEKIVTIHHGVDTRFGTASDADVRRLRQTHHLDTPYILAVGTVQPRKNLPVLARAVAEIVANGRDVDLVIAGKMGWKSEDVLRDLLAANLGDRLRILRYVDDQELPALYQGAEAFVLPSHFEGFGMPLVEAMRSRIPTFAADTSCLPEILADGGEIFPADDPHALATLLDRALTDTSWSMDLRARAVARSRAFSWEIAATQTCRVLTDAIH